MGSRTSRNAHSQDAMPWDVVLTALVELRDEVNKLKRDRLPPAPMPCRVNEGASTSQGTQHNSSPVHNFTGFLDPICEAGVVTEQNFSDSVLMHNAKIFGPLDMVSEDIDQQGDKPTNIGRSLALSHSTVATIIKDEERIMEHVKGFAPMKATVITKQRSGLIIEMERLLMLWLEEQNQQCIPVSLIVIQKAKRLFEALKQEKGEGSESEVASSGWFMRFKARTNYHNLKVQGEAASGDEKAASEFPKALAEIIKEGGYSAHQVFNVDETGLIWKRMPDRTYIAKEEKSAPGHKASKERLTLLFGRNAAGDFKLKPLVVYQAENPRVLLVLDNAHGHPAHLGDFNPNVKVVYLPPNTTALLQPMDQGVIASF
ncbi:tigger transposable element-derived protein 1-like [Portunus trituberculatus]|uniref:tigger transposable element-derived protein 1-like n=1 Tax=Portunus trituberculatus TaxID=210409 RepID=UPI001E1D1F1B|nr:tigger transposable element-derived protein 1-like [Portunus trituberculatus]